MIEHHIQKSIVSTLAFAHDPIVFSELKPEGMENKLFDYHLKQLIRDGFVAKSSDKKYSLTPEGKRLGTRISESILAQANKAESVLFLIVRRKEDGAWLMYERLTHPLINMTGFMHARPRSDQTVAETAREACGAIGITASFQVAGSGIFRMHRGEEIESFTNFTLLVAEDGVGEIVQNDSLAKYYWEAHPDFNSPTMFPNMKFLAAKFQENALFFLEKDLSL